MTYRPDIDGLRAIAVLAVMLYHFGFPHVTGGYVGVDIFFVISGFLITGIITREIKENKFSLAHFYERRVRRIFPALFSVFIFTTIIGGIIFLPDSFEDYGASLLTSTLFISNILFWIESGYFDSASEMKPLLHTWSLSVEEQFYIFFPPLLMWIATKGKAKFLPVVLTLALISFAIGLWQINTDQEAAFYLIHTRFWELALGGLLALGLLPASKSSLINQTCSFVGFGLIGIAIFALSDETRFPGAYALLPCVGTALMIYAGGNTFLNKAISCPPMRWTGLISYSLYLWHWPIFVYFNYLMLRDPSIPEGLIMVVASYLFAALSWQFIEQPFRKKPYKHKRGEIFLYAVSAMLVTVFLANIIYTSKGLPQRLPSTVKTYFTDEYKYSILENRNMYECLGDNSYNSDAIQDAQNEHLCPIGNYKDNQSPTFILWGDSHAETLRAGLEKIAAEQNAYGIFAGFGSCPPILNLPRYDDVTDECIRYNQAVLGIIEKHNIKNVILSSRWASVTSGRRYKTDADYRIYLDPSRDLSKNPEIFERKFNETLDILKKKDVNIYIVSPVPEIGHNVFLYYIRSLYMNFSGLNIESLRPSLKEYKERNKIPLDYFNSLEGVQIIHPYKALCDEDKGCMLLHDGTPLYRDNDHLSRYGSEYIAEKLDLVLKQATGYK